MSKVISLPGNLLDRSCQLVIVLGGEIQKSKITRDNSYRICSEWKPKLVPVNFSVLYMKYGWPLTHTHLEGQFCPFDFWFSYGSKSKVSCYRLLCEMYRKTSKKFIFVWSLLHETWAVCQFCMKSQLQLLTRKQSLFHSRNARWLMFENKCALNKCSQISVKQKTHENVCDDDK